MTPRSKYDFKFKDFAPMVFRFIRSVFHVDPNEYLVIIKKADG
jgi:1-phosphatidylinositol-4-phosphate 5-kinase